MRRAPNRIERCRDQEGNTLLCDSAMGAEPFASEGRKIVLGSACAEGDAEARDHRHIPFHFG